MAEMGRIMTHSKDRRRLATVSDAHALAQFLLVRRRAVQPADVGLPTTGRRRVAGLRRAGSPGWPALASRTTSASSRHGAAGVR
jgi:hypothetical protein